LQNIFIPDQQNPALMERENTEKMGEGGGGWGFFEQMYLDYDSSSLIVSICSIKAMAGGEKNERDPWWQGERNGETPVGREIGTGEIEAHCY
jgi:hypothetical protein